MAISSKGTPGKGSSASKYSSAVVFFTILLFVMKDTGFDGAIGLALLVTVIMWIVQAQKDKKKRSTGWDYEHKSDADNDEPLSPSPDSLEQKNVIERRPHPSADAADTSSDLSDDKLLSDSFTALTGALPGILDDPEKHDEPVRPHHQTLPTPTYAQPSPSTTPDPDGNVPEPVGIYSYEPLPSEIPAPRFDTASLSVPEAPPLPLCSAHSSASPETPTTQGKHLSAVAVKSPTSTGTAKVVADYRFDDIHCGSAAISMTQEPSTMRLHDASEDHGSCLLTSSIFSQH
ncbi:hypothetical protein [Cutibacterium sp. V947]|uniref:hypothetical protein n=1 Tax=unclassified Cutibacterium TaxID=2649671 RepID=UPI003EE0AD0E